MSKNQGSGKCCRKETVLTLFSTLFPTPVITKETILPHWLQWALLPRGTNVWTRHGDNWTRATGQRANPSHSLAQTQRELPAAPAPQPHPISVSTGLLSQGAGARGVKPWLSWETIPNHSYHTHILSSPNTNVGQWFLTRGHLNTKQGEEAWIPI